LTIKLGESGKDIRFSAGFDMSSNTELTLTFRAPPSGTDFTRIKSDGVTLGTGAITDPVLGELAANTYVDYTCSATDFDVAGTWSVCLTYTNDVTTPDEIFISSEVEFEIGEAC